MITDKLASYPAAKKDLLPAVEHRNRAENSHQPIRRRERQMKRFTSARQAQQFLATHEPINNLFHLRCDHVTADQYPPAPAFDVWAAGTGAGAAAWPLLRSPRLDFLSPATIKLTVPLWEQHTAIPRGYPAEWLIARSVTARINSERSTARAEGTVKSLALLGRATSSCCFPSGSTTP
jgi:DDE domain